MKQYRNWIEEELKKRISFQPVNIGTKGGRKIYTIEFEDGDSKEYYIDFEQKTIEEY